MGEYISVRGMSQEGVFALPSPVRGYRHKSFGIREYHDGLLMWGVGETHIRGGGWRIIFCSDAKPRSTCCTVLYPQMQHIMHEIYLVQV